MRRIPLLVSVLVVATATTGIAKPERRTVIAAGPWSKGQHD